MNVKVTGSSPVYHPNANDKSDNAKTAKEKGGGESRSTERESAKERSSDASVHKKAKKTKFSITKISESKIIKWE